MKTCLVWQKETILGDSVNLCDSGFKMFLHFDRWFDAEEMELAYPGNLELDKDKNKNKKQTLEDPTFLLNTWLDELDTLTWVSLILC